MMVSSVIRRNSVQIWTPLIVLFLLHRAVFCLAIVAQSLPPLLGPFLATVRSPFTKSTPYLCSPHPPLQNPSRNFEIRQHLFLTTSSRQGSPSPPCRNFVGAAATTTILFVFQCECDCGCHAWRSRI